MRRLVFAAGLSLISFGAQAAEICDQIGYYYFTHDSTREMSLSIKSGTTCESTFSGISVLLVQFKRLWLVSAPARGKIRLREGGYYIYTAPVGAGSDKFTLKVCGSQNNSNGCATINYTVNVQ